MNLSRPSFTPNFLPKFPFPINSLKRSICSFPLTERSFTSERKNGYYDKRNDQTSTECNTRDSVITVDQNNLKMANNLEQIKDYVLQNLESLPQKQLPPKLIDFQSHETKLCSSLKAIRNPKFHQGLAFDSDPQKKLASKENYYEIFQQKNEEFIKTTKNIQSYPLLPGDYFSFRSFFPHKIVEAYQREEKKKPVHFVHGYISSIDCLYFVVQKHLFLHFPIGSRLSFGESQNTIEMQFSNIIYSIKDTTVCLNGKQEIDVLVIGHQFHFEMYKVDETQKNPLIKLDLKYNTPNLFLPIIFTQKNGVIYYLPDDETTNLASLDLRTGQISNVQCVQAKKKQNSQKHSIQSKICQAWKSKNKLTWQKIREKLNQKLANSLLYDSDNWALKIGAKHCLQEKNIKMISCASSNITFIICLKQIKYVGVLGKYLKASDESLNRNAKTRKLVRVYWIQKGQAAMNFDHIQFDDAKFEILDIQASKATTKEREEFFQIILHNKETKTIVQKYYSIKQQIPNGSNCQVEINCTESFCFMKNVNLNFKMAGYENDQSVFNQGVSVLAKEDRRILVINNKLLGLTETFNKVGYVGVKTNNVLDPSLIVTLGSDEGFVRILQLTFLQWVFSAIQLQFQSYQQPINIEIFAEKLLINFIHASNRQSQNRCQSLLDLTTSQAMKYVIQLMTNLIILTNLKQDKEKCKTLKFTSLIKNVVRIKYLAISHHVNDLSISLISHYSLNFKSILNKNGIKSDFKLSHHFKCTINQIRDLIHPKVQISSSSKSFSPVHKLTHSNLHKDQKAGSQIEKDTPITVQPYLLSVEISDPNMITEKVKKDSEHEMSLKSENLYSSLQRQRQKHDDFNQTIKSIQKSNKTSQTLFSHQNKGRNKLERGKDNGEIASAIKRFCVANALIKIMNSVWTKPIGQVSINTVQIMINQINCIKSLGQEIGQYIVPKQNQHYATNEHFVSAFEDQDLSKIRYQSRKFFESKLIYSSFCETLELIKMIREAYNEHPWKFAEFLFVEFMQDYDSMLLDAWDAQMHKYLNCKLEIGQNPHLKSMPLKFWLQLYILISPVHSKTKITKMIKNSAPNNQKLISQQRIIPFMEQIKQNQQKIRQVYIVIPQFFLHFLQTNKGLTQTDIRFCFAD